MPDYERSLPKKVSHNPHFEFNSQFKFVQESIMTSFQSQLPRDVTREQVTQF